MYFWIVELGYGLTLAGNLTYTWGVERTQDGVDVPLSRIPPLFGTVRLRYDSPSWGRWAMFGETYVRGAGKQERLSSEDEADTRIPEGGTPGWWTVSIRSGVSLDRWLRLVVAAENLLDRDYKYHASGVYAPGFNLVATIEGSL